MSVPVFASTEAGLDFGRKGRRALRVAEFAQLAACSTSTVHKMIAAGKLRAVRVGDSAWRIPPAVAEAFLAGDEAGYIPTQPGERCPSCGQQVWAEAT